MFENCSSVCGRVIISVLVKAQSEIMTDRIQIEFISLFWGGESTNAGS
jgi:hypothetical protein